MFMSKIQSKPSKTKKNHQKAEVGQHVQIVRALLHQQHAKRPSVKPPAMVDEKSFHMVSTADEPVFTAAQMKDFLRNAGSGKGKHGLKNVKVWLWFSSSDSVSSGGTAQAPVNRIRPSDSTEFASMAALFDEYKGLAVRTEYAVHISGTTVPVDVTMQYDPTDATGVTNNVTGLSATYHKLTRMHASFGNPSAMNPTGFWSMKLKIPQGAQVEVASGVPGPGVWVDVGVTSYDLGWFKSYISAPTAAITTTLRQYIGMLVEFRMRS
jgi:hypothetical protein